MTKIHPFDSLMELPTHAVRLDCAAIHLARDVYPDLNALSVISALDDLADEVAALRPGLSAPTRYQALREVLVEQHNIVGNQANYYDPDNSYLNRVLERGMGIPISLSLIWLEVGRRLKWPVSGISFPGHFLVRFDDQQRFLVVDPFSEGRSLSPEDCKALLQRHAGSDAEFSLSLLEPTDAMKLLGRLLGNLQSIYRSRRDWTRLEQVLRRTLALSPRNPALVRELAELELRSGKYELAYTRLQQLIKVTPKQERAEDLTRRLREVEAEIALLN